MSELAKALAAAQGKFKAPSKDRKVSMVLKTGGKKEYAYADLATVIATNQSVLAEHGLSLFHQIDETEKGTVLKTELLHSSGENRMSTMWLPSYGGPQELGSLLTYYRRYAVSAMLGVAADEDDDGESAQQSTRAEAYGVRNTPKAAVRPNGSTTQLMEEIKFEMQRVGITKEQAQADVKSMFNKAMVSDLTHNEMVAFKHMLTNKKEQDVS